jgi:pimeloyl-ACP methyl ester carboxylesterase
MSSIAIRFYENKLSAAIHSPKISQNTLSPTIIFVHGFVGSKIGDHRLFVKAANFFSKKGFICFRFDFGGCGESDGDYQEVTLTKQLNELKEAIHYVSTLEGVDPKRIILVGHSLGGAITALTAPKFPQIQTIVLWSPVARPYQDIEAIVGKEAVIEAKKNGLYDYRGFLLSSDFFEDLKKYEPLEAITSYEGSIFIIHGNQDQEVPVGNVSTYINKLNQNRNNKIANFSFINRADHTFTSTTWENELYLKTNDWFNSLKNPRSY